MMVGQIAFQDDPRLSFLESIYIPDKVEDMHLKFRFILDEHHLLFKGSQTQSLLNVVRNDIAHYITHAEKEQNRHLIRRPDGLH